MADSPHVVTVTTATFQQVVLDGSFDRPVLVDFWAAWCAPCKQLMPLLARLADEFHGAFLLAKVDTEAEPDLAAHFGIRSLPTVQLFRNGQPVDQFMGALPEAQVREFLTRHITSATEQLLGEARAEMAVGNTAAAAKLIERVRAEEPANPRLFVAEVALKAAEGDADGALALLERTPIELIKDAELAALRGQLTFVQALAGAPDTAELAARLAAEPGDSAARYQLAARLVLAGDFEGALEHLFTLMKRDRAYGEDAARKGMIAVFDLLGGTGELVSRYRNRMLAAMY